MTNSQLQPELSGETTGVSCRARTIRELIDERAQVCGDSLFLLGADNDRSLTYGQFQAQCRAMVAILQSFGLHPGDKVAFLLDNGLYTAQLFLGSMYGGMVAVPLNVRAGVSQLAFTIDHSDANVVFVEEQYAALARAALAEVTRSVEVVAAEVDALASELLSSAAPSALPPVNENDVALLMYTSGSVGQPKAAIHSHKTLLAHGRNSARSHQLTATDRSLLVLPIYHINAECVTLMPTMVAGGSVVVPNHFNVSRFWDWLDDYRCTWSAIVPTIISQLLDWRDPKADQRRGAYERIRFIRSSSAPLSPSLQREFMERFPIRLIQAMGSSEAGNIFANPQAPGANKIGTPGKAWGFETRIIAPDGADVAPGQPGEVLIRGDAVMQGYYKDQEQTRAVLDADGWLHTGDLAYQDSDGYFFIIGRSKELIIKGGMNIAPRQIDEVLESHPAVFEAAVVGVPDRYLGEDLVAYVVLRKGQAVDESALLSFCESRLGHFKTPTHIHFVSDLPKGPSGKVQRLRLLELAGTATRGTDNGNHSAPAQIAPTAVADALLQSWSEVLNQSGIGRDVNFFALGGHSLAAIKCLAAIREKLGIVLSLTDFFEHPTVEQQMNLIAERLHARTNADGGNGRSPASLSTTPRALPTANDGGAQAIPVSGRPWSHPLSSGQRRIWFFEELAPGFPLYNESEAVRLIGELNAPALEQALNLVIARHEMLRSTIRKSEQGPEVLVHPSFVLRIKQVDLSALWPAQSSAEVERLLREEPRAPYDLANTPGIRATLIRLTPTEHVFILMMHHLICDWASEGVIWRELSAAYRALVRGETPNLPALPIQYGDYAIWQQKRTLDGAFAEDLDFWAKTLEGAPELLDLPTDRPRPQVQSYRGARQRFRLNADLTAAMRSCSRNEKASLFAFSTAALKVLLYRYSGAEDLVIGVPIAERERPELAAVIGFLIHTQALRTRLSGAMTFRDLLAQVQKGALDLYAHREVPFEQVVSRLQPRRSLSHAPLFQVMINWRDQDQHLSFIGLEGLEVRSELAEAGTSKFDLTFFLTDFGDEIWMEVEYSTEIFDSDRIARMFTHFATLLQAAAADPSRRLDELPLLTEGERRQVLFDWNASAVEYPRDRCIHELVERQAERTPDAVAVVCEGREVTYRQLNQRANQLAHHLQSLGVGPDVLVGICAERSIEMVVGLLGILKAGGAYVPLDPEYPPERLSFMLEDAAPAVLLTQAKLLDVLPQRASTTFCLDRDWPLIADKPVGAPESAVNSDHLAYVIYTSGSTGKPKGAMNTHGAIRNRLCWMQDEYGLSPADVVLQKTSFSFDVSVWEFFWPLLNGARLVLARPGGQGDSQYLTEAIHRHGVTTIHFVPSMLRAFVNAAEADKCRSLQRVICSGEALPFDLQEQYFSRFQASLCNLYGPTEAAVDVTFWNCRTDYGKNLVPIGRPIANVAIYILDNQLNPVPIGIPGELFIGGVGVGRGYLGRPELTAEKFVADPFSGSSGARMYRTGDRGRYLPDGNIEFLGRNDDQVKLRGFRIELGEIEAVLREHLAIGQCVVIARDDTVGQKQLVAYLVPRDPDRVPKADELRRSLKQKLPDYMIPAAFVTLERLPLTASGKINRKALPAPELGRVHSERPFVAPRTPTEEVLAGVCREVLGIGEIGVHDDFFVLGGNSLQVIQVLARVGKLFNQHIPVPVFFLNPTVEGLSRALHESDPRNDRDQLIGLASGTKPGTLFFLDAGVGQCRLARLLKTNLASFATVVSLPGLADGASDRESIRTFPSVESLAAKHVALIRSVERSGPLVLVGHSFGGTIACEVAHQLKRHGISVEMILLLDAWRKLPFRRRQSLLWEEIKAKVALRSRLRQLTERFKAIADQPSMRESNQVDSYQPSDIPAHLYLKSRRNYRYRPLGCRAVLLRTSDAGAGAMGWDGLFSGGLEIVDVPGDHWTLLKEPHLQVLAQRIDERLESRPAPGMRKMARIGSGASNAVVEA